MKAFCFFVTALATMALAAPTAQNGAEVAADNLETRQMSGCTRCSNGRYRCYSCNSGGCSYGNWQRC